MSREHKNALVSDFESITTKTTKSDKMPEIRSCLFLLTSIFAGWSLVSGTRSILLSGCIGDSKDLFQNITFSNNTDKVVSLYKNGVGNMLIAMWSMQQSFLNVEFYNGYSKRLFLDKIGTIWIRNLHISDEATYTLQTEEGRDREKFMVQLLVLVPPTTNCKPKIVRVDNILTAHLALNGCGKPAASPYWLEHSGISYENNMVKLQPGKEAGIYHACIESEALRCTNSSKYTEYCTYLKINESTSPSGSSDMEGHTILIICASLLGIIVFGLVMILVGWFLKTRKSVEGETRAGRHSKSENYREVRLRDVILQTDCSEDKYQQTDIDQNNQETELDGNDENRDHGNQNVHKENDDALEALFTWEKRAKHICD